MPAITPSETQCHFRKYVLLRYQDANTHLKIRQSGMCEEMYAEQTLSKSIRTHFRIIFN